jgi:hypothetical protein
MFSSTQNAFCFTNLSHLVIEIFGFFENHAQNLNTPQNNLASWDLQMGFNSAFKGLTTTLLQAPKLITLAIKGRWALADIRKISLFLIPVLRLY